MTDPARLTATEAVRQIRAGRLSPVTLMEACLDRIAAREPAIRAFAHLDPQASLRGAAMAPTGPLHGLPFGVKDVFDTADMPTAYNSPIYAGHHPRADAAAVAWTRRAGGVLIGKTVTTEFAYRQPGPTANPHDITRTPGGSSSGSAAGVADFFFPLAFGTQTAGSNIRPSAYCGIVGYKPSFGLISRVGLKQLSDSLDHVGLMARGVADCALLGGAISGQDLGDPDIKPGAAPRIGACHSPSWPKAAPETQSLLAEVAGRLGRAGAVIEGRELPSDYLALEDAHRTVLDVEASRGFAWELATSRDGLSQFLRDRLDWGLAQPFDALSRARDTLLRGRLAFPAVMDGLDILLTPSAPGEAPVGLDWTGDASFNYIWTGLHLPCVTVPAGHGPNGMPLGIQIVGRQGEDRAVLAWAQWVAAALG
jgi:Asp-tRNA(Asn)/Glu-tRNA(Gln) amidotransferase A subunit family amidase